MLDAEVKTFQTIETIVALTQQSYESFVYAGYKKWINGFIEV